MKTVKKLGKVVILLTGVLWFMSCEKSDVTTETVEINEEGFKSETGNHDQELNEQESEAKHPVLHMRFDSNVSKEDAELKWNEAVKDYFSKNPIQNKMGTTEVYFQISTYTGTQTYNGTDAAVQASVDFNHDQGSFHTDYLTLNNPGNDREEGQSDFYLVRILFPNIVINWIEIEHAHLRLQGTDGWVANSFNIWLLATNQTVAASGASFLFSSPSNDIGWLDNNTATGWDYYHTGNIGTGRLNF